MTLRGRDDIRRVGLVGGGVIGTGWSIRCLARGLDVSVTDPAPGAEENLREAVGRAWPIMEQVGLADGASQDRLDFVSSIEEAVSGADFVQENVPEHEDLKIEVFSEIGRHAPRDAIIASSSSGFLPTRIQARTEAPERVIIGHPFSPLYILPLVEIVGGRETSEEAVRAAAGYYRRIGMRPLHVRNEIDAYISDRLQQAVWHESLHLVNDGIATIPEIDAAITGGPGLRWAFMGTAMAWHLAAGEGGMRATLAHFGPAMELPWTKLKAPELTDELARRVIEGCDEATGDRDWREMQRRRDICLLKIQEVINEHWYPPGEDGWPEMEEV
jgi:carnitine 3-dehydrogenase